jgi:3-dehydroquinate synthase
MSKSRSTRIGIELGERSYDIHVGAGMLDGAGEIVSAACRGRSAAIVTNRRIGERYAGRLTESLACAGISAQVITLPTGERFKTLKTMARIYERLLDQRLDRGGIVIGLGGGVIGDMAGFAAATYLRGVDFVQVPTSLLAQVDASVGGKTGVNLSRGKNLVGAFYQPKAVIIDVSVLRTLPTREFRSGLAEVIKHGIIRDSGYFAFLEQNLQAVRRRAPEVLERTVARSCEIKADVVSQDEREAGLRRILNFGHTVGHTIESLSGYGKYSHGEAVAIGMVTAAIVSAEMSPAEPDMVSRIVRMIKTAGLPYQVPPGITHQDIVAAMGFDKKVTHGKLHTVLVRRIGEAYVSDDVTPEIWLKALDKQAQL